MSIIARIFVVGIALLLGSERAFTAGLPNGPKIRVRISISSDPKIDEPQITSYLSRRLRQIPDVVVVDDDPLIAISVICFRTQNIKGYETGYAISTVVISSLDARLICNSFGGQLPADLQGEFNKELASLWHFEDQWLNVCGPDQLKLLCGKLVDQIDGKDLERVRLLAQKLVDMGILNEGSQPSGDQTPSDQHTTNDNTSASLDDSADYKAAEAELTKVYAELRSHLSEKEKLALKKEEVAWLTKRSRLRGDSAAFIAETRARIRELTSRLRY